MHIKKLKRKCTVKGCRCTDTYNVSISSEPGGSVIVCRKCAEAAAKAIAEYEKTPANLRKKPVENRPAPPLFFHATSNPKETAETLTEVAEQEEVSEDSVKPEEVPKIPEDKKSVQRDGNKNRTKNSK